MIISLERYYFALLVLSLLLFIPCWFKNKDGRGDGQMFFLPAVLVVIMAWTQALFFATLTFPLPLVTRVAASFQ